MAHILGRGEDMGCPGPDHGRVQSSAPHHDILKISVEYSTAWAWSSRRLGQWFRRAYYAQAYKEGRRLKDVALEMTKLSAAELDKLLDPRPMCDGGIVEGAGG